MNIELDKRFYAGLPCLLVNARALANAEQLSTSDASYLRSCITAAMVSLGFMQETIARLVGVNNHTDAANRIEQEAINNFMLDLNTTFGGLMVALMEISDNISSGQTDKGGVA